MSSGANSFGAAERRVVGETGGYWPSELSVLVMLLCHLSRDDLVETLTEAVRGDAGGREVVISRKAGEAVLRGAQVLKM